MFCPDSAVVVVIQIFDEFLFEVLHGLKFFQIYKQIDIWHKPPHPTGWQLLSAPVA